jgi:hypothetical protein
MGSAVADSALTCPACGGPNDPGTAICAWCGTALATPSAPVSQTPDAQRQPPPPPGPTPAAQPYRVPPAPPQANSGCGRTCLAVGLGCVVVVVAGFIILMIIGAIATSVAPTATPSPHAVHRGHR